MENFIKKIERFEGESFKKLNKWGKEASEVQLVVAYIIASVMMLSMMWLTVEVVLPWCVNLMVSTATNLMNGGVKWFVIGLFALRFIRRIGVLLKK